MTNPSDFRATPIIAIWLLVAFVWCALAGCKPSDYDRAILCPRYEELNRLYAEKPARRDYETRLMEKRERFIKEHCQ